MIIRVISCDALNDYNEEHETDFCSANDLSDEVFKAINEEYCGGWHFDSFEEFVDEFNADGSYAPMPSEHFIRMFNE